MHKSLLTEIIYGDLRRRGPFRAPDAFIKRYGGLMMTNHDLSDKLQFNKYSPNAEILGVGTDEGVFYYGQVKQFLNYYGPIVDENVAQPARIEPDSRGHGISDIKFLQNNKIGLMSLGGFFYTIDTNTRQVLTVLNGPVQTVYCPSDENPNLMVMGTRDDLLLAYDIRDPNNVKLKSTINPAGTPSRKIKTPKRVKPSTPKSSSRKTAMPSPVQAEKLSDICHLYDHFFATTSTSNEKGIRVWDMRYAKHYCPVQTFKIEKCERTNFGAYSMNVDRDRVSLVVGCTDGVFREYAFRSACTTATRLYSGGSISNFQQNIVHSPFSDHFVGPLRDGIGIWDKRDKPLCVDTWKRTQNRSSFSANRSISNRELHFIEPRFGFKSCVNDSLAHCDWSPSGRYIAMVTRQNFIICDGESQWSREVANRDLSEVMSGRPRLPSPSDLTTSLVHSNSLQANGYRKRRMDASEKQPQPGSSRVITIDEEFEPSRLMKKTQSRMDDYLKGPKKEQSVRNTGHFRTASGKRVSKEVLPVITAETAVVRPVRHGPLNPYRPASTSRNSDRNEQRESDRPSYNTSAYQPSGLYRPRSLNSAFKLPLSVDGESTQKHDESENLEGDDLLFNTDPVLKAMEKNIIEMIKSEIIVLDVSLNWDDVVGLESAKRVLREIIILPFKRPDVFKGIRAPPKGVLLFGPPGTGKTLIARCVANQCKATFFNISASSLTSKWVGEGEKLVRALFRVARLKEPSVIFIDELDSLLSSRRESEHESSRRIKTELLVQMDGVCSNSNERLLILAATNKPHELDEAARRRFAKRLYIALPTKEARYGMLAKHLSSLLHNINDESMSKLADKTEGFSGADMRQLCCEAAMGPIREIDDMSTVDIETVKEEDIRPICFADFEDALCSVKRTVLQSELDGYMEWDEQFGCSKLLKSAQDDSPAKALPLAAMILNSWCILQLSNKMLLLVGILVLFVGVGSELIGGKDCVVEGRVYKSGEFFLYRSHFNTSCIDGQVEVVNCVTSRGTSFPLGTLRFTEDDQKPKGRAPKVHGKLEDEVAEECEFGEEQFVREGFAVSCVSNELLGCVDEFGDLVREGLYVTAKGALRFCYVYQNKRRARIERQGCFNGTRDDDPNDKRFHFSKGQIWHTKEYDFRCGDDGFQVYKCKPSAKELVHTGVAWFDRENVLNICQLT